MYDLFGGNRWLFHLVDEQTDGMFLLDLENPEEEFLSPRFWTNLGIDPQKQEHKAGEWKKLINSDDLENIWDIAMQHVSDPSVPFLGEVHYTTTYGTQLRILCFGNVVDRSTPTRLFGIHKNLSEER